MDLKCVLDDKDKGNGTELNIDKEGVDDNIRIHKKPMQLRDIENRSTNKRKLKPSHDSEQQIKDLLIKEKKEVYKQNWNKLDIGMRINRIKDFVNEKVENEGLNLNQKSRLLDLLIHACNRGFLNKNSDIVYDKEECKISRIQNLKFNEETGDFTFEIIENKKTKVSSSKSRSNIDRFLKPKK